MSSNILDYIILAVIFVVIINIFMRTFGNNQCPNIPNSSKNEFMGQLDNSSNDTSIIKDKNEEDLFSQMAKEKRLYDEKLNDEEREKQKDSIGGCPVVKMNNETDRYIRDIILGGKFLCKDKPEETTNDEIDDFQNDFFGFSDKINYSSNESLDMVDKLNEIFSSGDTNLVNYNGKNISDIYNDLTKNDVIDNCVTNKCILPPDVDRDMHVGSYIEDSGQTYSNYNWKYADDTVNNGGKFYENIEGYDKDFEYELIYKSNKK